MKLKVLLLTLLAGLAVLPTTAQETDEYLHRMAQATLFPPVGTNGLEASRYVNHISLNLLWGVSSGLNGLEVGGIANIEKDFVKGAQFAGVLNLVRNNVTGLQASNVVNYSGGKVLGGQLAGFMNLSDDLAGLSLAGFMNMNEDLAGIQGAGFLNIARGIKGFQGSGFMNISRETAGFQGAGFLNISGDLKGAQSSGFMNMAGDAKGAQLAGFMNIAEDIRGAQVSGFLNIAGEVRGTQIGVINIAENYEKGVPIGLINIVKGGYHDWELAANEIWNFNIGYRMGIDRLYSQFFLGTRYDQGTRLTGTGFGFGTRFRITGYFKGSVDLISYQIMERRHRNPNRANLLEQVRFTLEGRIFRGLKWFAGPTFNALILPFEYPEPALFESLDTWVVYESVSGVSYIKMWPGFSAGLRF